MAGAADKSRQLIELTPNPHIAFGMRLGRDELFAGLAGAFLTVVVKAGFTWLGGGAVAPQVERAALVVVGPLFEKPALLTKYMLDAWREYRSTAPAERQPIRHYLLRVLREGWPTLRADLLFHDPSYSVLFWLLLLASPGAGPMSIALMAIVSFVAAVALASTAEVLAVECAYRLRHWRFRRAGFVTKSYYEARFLLDPEGDGRYAPQAVLDRLQQKFALGDRKVFTYRDVYVTENSVAVYNGRKPYLRFRRRLTEDGTVSKQAVQVMNTRSREVRMRGHVLYRCFATLKCKSGYDFPLDQAMPWDASAISDPRVRRIVEGLQSGDERREVLFRRDVAVGKEQLFVSVDTPAGERPASEPYWLEVKVRNDLDLLQEVSDYIAWKLPVRGATQSKCDLLSPSDGTPVCRPKDFSSSF